MDKSSLLGAVVALGGLTAAPEPKTAPAAGTEPSVSVTSFYMAGRDTYAAELCGLVVGAAGDSVVRVTVDPDSRRPGVYNALAGSDGRFCVVVQTYQRLASVSVRALGKTASSAPAKAEFVEERR